MEKTSFAKMRQFLIRNDVSDAIPVFESKYRSLWEILGEQIWGKMSHDFG